MAVKVRAEAGESRVPPRRKRTQRWNDGQRGGSGPQSARGGGGTCILGCVAAISACGCGSWLCCSSPIPGMMLLMPGMMLLMPAGVHYLLLYVRSHQDDGGSRQEGRRQRGGRGGHHLSGPVGGWVCVWPHAWAHATTRALVHLRHPTMHAGCSPFPAHVHFQFHSRARQSPCILVPAHPSAVPAPAAPHCDGVPLAPLTVLYAPGAPP